MNMSGVFTKLSKLAHEIHGCVFTVSITSLNKLSSTPLYTESLRYPSFLLHYHSPNTTLSQWPLVYWHFISGTFKFQRVTEVISRLLASLWPFSSSKGQTDRQMVMIRQTLKLKLRWASAPADRSWQQRTSILFRSLDSLIKDVIPNPCLQSFIRNLDSGVIFYLSFLFNDAIDHTCGTNAREDTGTWFWLEKMKKRNSCIPRWRCKNNLEADFKKKNDRFMNLIRLRIKISVGLFWTCKWTFTRACFI
jgi:hypothetical protein